MTAGSAIDTYIHPYTEYIFPYILTCQIHLVSLVMPSAIPTNMDACQTEKYAR